MGLQSLQAAYNFLSTHSGLADFFGQRYPGMAPRHIIGYKKPINANDYPSVCYVPIKALIGKNAYDLLTISIVLSLNEKDISGHVFDGVTYSNQAAQIIVDAIRGNSFPFNIVDDEVSVVTDMGLQHPFYDTEIQFTMIAFRP